MVCALQVSQEQFDKIMGLIQTGIDEGAKLEVGGKRYGMSFYLRPVAEILAADHRPAQPSPLVVRRVHAHIIGHSLWLALAAGEKGYYIQPTVFSNVEDHMTIARDEIFGPVQSILKWSTVEEVIARANDTMYGLAAGVWTRNLDTANTIGRALKAGTIWTNTWCVFAPCSSMLLTVCASGHMMPAAHHLTLWNVVALQVAQLLARCSTTPRAVACVPFCFAATC